MTRYGRPTPGEVLARERQCGRGVLVTTTLGTHMQCTIESVDPDAGTVTLRLAGEAPVQASVVEFAELRAEIQRMGGCQASLVREQRASEERRIRDVTAAVDRERGIYRREERALHWILAQAQPPGRAEHDRLCWLRHTACLAAQHRLHGAWDLACELMARPEAAQMPPPDAAVGCETPVEIHRQTGMS